MDEHLETCRAEAPDTIGVSMMLTERGLRSVPIRLFAQRSAR